MAEVNRDEPFSWGQEAPVSSLGESELPRIGAHIRSAGGLSRVVPRAIEMGAEAVQVFNSNARTWRTQARTPEEIATFLDGLLQHRLPLFFHSIYLINLASPDEHLRLRSSAALADALALGGRTQARGVVTHVGSRHHQTFCEVTGSIADGIRRAFLLAGEHLAVDGGGELPCLLLETGSGSGTMVGGRLEELEALLDLVPDFCGVCLDTAHLFAAGYPLHTEEGLEETIAQLSTRGLLSSVGLVHLNDSRTPLGCTSDRHENLGEGLIGFSGLSRVVRHPAFRQVPFVLEVPGVEGHGPDARNIERAKAMRRGASVPPEPPAPSA